jgi:hypothetical protein
VTHSAFAVRPRLAWMCAIAVLTAATAGYAEVRGREARTSFSPPAEFRGARWATVGDAGEAVRVWGEAGLRGRKVLLLTGRWARVKDLGRDVIEAAAAGQAPFDLIDADTAVLVAARSGIARDLQVVLPPAAYAQRLDEVRGAKEIRQGEGWLSLPFHGFERRFAVPAALAPPGEAVLALVEPSFFSDGAPQAPDQWLRERGVEVELGLVALSDPAATDAQRARAAAFAQGARAVAVEVAR